ncbi:MAG: KH domain-containing protein [Actinomycetes bacterium]
MSEDFVDEIGAPGNRIEGGTAKAVVEYVARSIVDTPDAVDVSVKERGRGIELLIAADPDDMGRLIGKRGRVIQAVRQVARAAGAADGVATSVDVLE